MSLNKLIIIFGIILVIFAGVVFFQFSAKPDKASSPKISGPAVTINGHTFKVETAKTQKEQTTGLSGRNSLPEDEGMLFIFGKADYYNFWMKNMEFPLDIIFIKDNKIVTIIKNAKIPANPNENPQILKPTGLVNKVLEINAGLADQDNIKKGDSVKINL
jgi:uncharacterized membrane protein (UPF0127 family)